MFIISTGVSVIKEINSDTDFTISNKTEEAKTYEFIGDAIRDCIKINNYTNRYDYKVSILDQRCSDIPLDKKII